MAEGAPTSNEAPGFFVFLAFVFTLLGTDGTWKGKNCQKNQWWEMWETTWKEMKEQTKGRNNQRTKGKTGKKAFRRFVSLFNLILPSRLGFFTHTHTRTKQTCVLLFSIESTLLPSSYCSFSPSARSPHSLTLGVSCSIGSFLFFLVLWEDASSSLVFFSLNWSWLFSFQSVDVASSSVLLPTKERKMLRQQEEEEEEEGASKDKGGVYLMGRAHKRWWWPLCNCSW